MNSEGKLDNGKEGREQYFLNENTKHSEARVLVDDRDRIVELTFYNHEKTEFLGIFVEAINDD